MRKPVFLFLFILFLSYGCSEKPKELRTVPSKTSIKSDNSELEEAKAISRKIFKGIEKVEKEEATPEEFRAYAKPLQEKLNSLIVNMEEEEVEELERYRDELMDEMVLTETNIHEE